MSGTRFYRLCLIGGVCWLLGAAIAFSAPWDDLLSFQGVDADPDKDYTLSEEHGPWMIMACSFSGEGAQKQAKELVLELRKRYKLPAYIYVGRFDPGEAQGRSLDEFGKPKKWQYMKYKDSKDPEKARRPELTEVAVMVGNYPSVEDAGAQKTLQKIKYAMPNCLEVKEGHETHQSLTGWRMIQKQVYQAIGSKKKDLGPMSHAFITRNPLLPAEFFAPKDGIDPLVLEMNKNAEFSLLDCPGKYTVQVATFKGKTVIKQEDIQAIEDGKKEMKSGLAEAAEKANRLARALRHKGYEAYEFHDRYASIVTVGSFSSVGTPRPDGKLEINPEIHKIMKAFGSEPTTLPGQTTPVTPLKSLVGIPFDIQPIPVEVPKRSISVALRNGHEN